MRGANPPRSKVPAQPRHSASHSRRHCQSTLGRARSPVSPEPKASREAGAMRGARRLIRLLQNHRRRRSLDRDLEPCRHVNAADKDLHVLCRRSSRDRRHPQHANGRAGAPRTPPHLRLVLIRRRTDGACHSFFLPAAAAPPPKIAANTIPMRLCHLNNSDHLNDLERLESFS